jgi:hypothetical protein
VNGKFPVLQPLTKSWEGCRKGVGGPFAYLINSRRIRRKPGDFDGHTRRLAGVIMFFEAPEQGFGRGLCVFNGIPYQNTEAGSNPAVSLLTAFPLPGLGFFGVCQRGAIMLMNKVFGKAFPLVLGLCLLAGALGLTGCPMEESDPDFGNDLGSLIGNWSSGTDGYEISETVLQYDDGLAAGSQYDGMDFTGSIEYHKKFSETAGVIIVKYITPPNGSASGKYQGVYYKDLSATKVTMGNAFTVADYTQRVEVGSLEEAKTKFASEENISLYGGDLSRASPQTKQ